MGTHAVKSEKPIRILLCLYLARQPSVGKSFLIHEVYRSHTTTHHIR